MAGEDVQNRSMFPEPPFFYKLFGDSNKETSFYEELHEPPEIPEKRIVFNRVETDNIVAKDDESIDSNSNELEKNNNDEKDDNNDNNDMIKLSETNGITLKSPNENLICQLRELNHSILKLYIEFLQLLRKPESFMFRFSSNIDENEIDSDNESCDLTIDDIDTKLLSNYLSELEYNRDVNSNAFVSNAASTNMEPILQSKSNEIREKFISMRNLLNSMRAHQARQTIIETLKMQINYKNNQCDKIENYIKNTNKLLNKNCDKIINKQLKKFNKTQNNENINQSENDTNNDDTRMAIMKQQLDQIFFSDNN